MFSSCLENIEPEGIKDLRGAKAELLRAQTALQAAQAAKLEADAALVLAQAKVQEAIAKQQEAIALKLQYEAELAQIQNEAEKAAIEQRIAEIEAQALITAEQLKAELLEAQAATTRAQAMYEAALKDLAVAKSTLTANEQAAVAALEAKVIAARNEVESKTVALQKAGVALSRAVAEIDDAGKSTMIAALEQAVVVAQAELEAAVEAEAEAKALLEVDKTIVDWDAKLQEYEAELDSISRAVVASQEKYNAAVAESGYALEQVADKVEEYVETTGYVLDFDPSAGEPTDWGTGKFVAIQDPYLITREIEVPAVWIKNEVAGDFVIPDGTTYVYGEGDAVLKNYFDAAINEYTYAYEYWRNYELRGNAVWAEELAGFEKSPAYLRELEYFNDVLAADKSGDYLTFFKKWGSEDYDVEAAIAEYNDALAAFEKGIADYQAVELKLVEDEAAFAQLENEYDVEKAKLDAEKAAGYQDVEAKYTAAKSAYDKALLVYEAAETRRDRAVQVAEATAGATKAEMETFEAAYVDAAATDEEKAKHALYVKALEEIKKAEEAFDNPDPAVKTDPVGVYAAALEQWLKDQKLYDYNGGSYDSESLYAAINKSYTEKKEDLDNKYDIKRAELRAKYPNFSEEYTDNWKAQLDGLRQNLENAYDKLDQWVDGYYCDADYDDYYGYAVNIYDYNGDFDYEYELPLYDVPSYLVPEPTSYIAEWKPVAIKLEDLSDKTYFMEEYLEPASEYMFESLELEVEFDDSSTENYELYADETADYPYVVPTYETVLDMFETTIKAAGYTLDDIRNIYIDSSYGVLADYYAEKIWYEIYTTGTDEYYNAVPDHIKAIEAAKAEFEAYVAAKNAELDEMKAEIEKAVTSLLDVIIPVYEEYLVQDAKSSVLTYTIMLLKNSIASYIDTYGDGTTPSPETLEAFEEALETAYNAAVDARIAAQKAVAEAEWAVTEAEAGNLNAVEIAQVKYDRAVTELAEAMAKLDGVTAALQDLLAVIFGAEEETPAE